MTVEIIDPVDLPVHLTALRNPFTFERETRDIAPGLTIAELLREVGIHHAVRVWVGEVEIWPEYFDRVRPRRGSVVTVRAVARGGGGGGGQGKNIGMLAVGILLIVAGVVLAIGGVATYGITATAAPYVISLGISLALSGLINILIPPPGAPKLKGLAGIVGSGVDPESPTLSIAGQQNALRPYAPIPVVLGRHRVFPPYAAMPFTESVGGDQYLRLLFHLTYGPCAISELKIGDTPLENFDEVETEFIQGSVGQAASSLYAVDVFEDPLSVVLTQAGGGQIRTSQANAAELSVDWAFPEGLVQFTEAGNKELFSVTVTVEYRLVGQTTFISAPGSPRTTTEARQGLVRNGLRWKPQRPAGPYGAAAWTQFGLASFTASRINDANLGVIAFDADAAAVGSWLMVDTTTPAEFGRVVVTSAGTGANATWTIQASDDKVTWTTVFTGFSTGASAGTQSAEWVPIVRRYWRLLKTNAATAGPDYYEVEFWQTTVGISGYDVQLTRTTADNSDPLIKNLVVWSALRTIGTSPPVVLDNVSLLAMRIKATDQLNGVVGDFNCIVETLIPDYATYAGTVLADSPLGAWRLGEPLGAPTAFDATGNGHAGVYSGSPVLGSPGLLIGDTDTAMLCDGSDDAVTTFEGLSAIDMGAMSFSIEAIFTPANTTGDKDIVGKGTLQYTGGGFGWSLLMSGTTLRFARTTATFLTATVAAATKYHVIATFDIDTGTANLWVNGSLADTDTWSTAAYADSYGLRLADGDYGNFAGTLDEVSIYPTVLSNTRITAHYNASLGTREWVTQRTSNPASHFRYVLQSTANARPLADARIDLTELQAWHQENSVGGRSCNLVVDYETTVYELLRVITSCGRATVTMNDDKYAPVRDLVQTVPVQHFTPRNSRRWNGTRVLPEAVHGVKVRFVNPAASWRQDERIVYDDGFTAANATRFAVLELHGVTDPDLAWRMGRYHLAVTRLRPEVYNLETDVEALVCRRGDLVRVTHDVVEFGLASGRIKTVTTSGGLATAITTDEAMPMEDGQSYSVRIRLSDGTSRLAGVATVAGEQTSLTFLAPQAAPLPAVGDLVMFGLTGHESVECLVARIVPSPDFMARISLVDYAPGVQNADQGAIPPYDSQITTQARIERMPPTPIIDGVVSDETVLVRDLDGSLASRIVIALHYLTTSNVQADHVEARWRRSDSSGPFSSLPPLPPDTSEVAIQPVEDGVTYDVRIRTVHAATGSTSPWAELVNYLVVGKTTVPPTPTNLRADTRHPEDQALLWDYATSPPDLAGFQVRRTPGTATNWESAIPMHVGLAGASPFLLPRIYGEWTLLVVAVDTSGNRSTPATLTVDFGDPRIHNNVESFDYKAANWPGSVTNGSEVADNLVADQVSTGFWTLDGNLFWSASGATLFWGGTYQQMTYEFTFTPAAGSAGARIIFQIAVSASGWTLEWKKGALAYAPFPGTLEDITEVQHTFRLITDASIVQGTVSQLTLIVDADDLEELHQNFATAVTTGTRLTLVNTYRAIKAVEATVRASGAETAISAIAADQQNTAGAANGPLIKSFDAAGAVVAGHVNATVKGY